MPNDCNQDAINATAQLITDDDALAVANSQIRIPVDEVIVEPRPDQYVAPRYLQKTAPQLVPALDELLCRLRDLNSCFVGERTVEAQATMSLTGEHEWLEEKFLGWCQAYFKIRGSLDRLNPKNGNDPWRLYCDCYQEFARLMENRIGEPGTINSSVLNLSQRFMLSAFADELLRSDIESCPTNGRGRFSCERNRSNAIHRVLAYHQEVNAFTEIIEHIADALPPAYSPNESSEWPTEVRARVARCSEDLPFLREVLCVLKVNDSGVQRILPDLWARVVWDVYHGQSVAALLTSSSPEPTTERTTKHLLAFRRDGWLCHREFPWLRVQPEYLPDERRFELAVNWYLLDTLLLPFYEAWDLLDREAAITRGQEADATDEEQGAAITVALAGSDLSDTSAPVIRAKQCRVPHIRLSTFEKITTDHFQCEWSQAKGSERKVFRHGRKQFKFGRHGADPTVSSSQIRSCLSRLEIPIQEFIAACR